MTRLFTILVFATIVPLAAQDDPAPGTRVQLGLEPLFQHWSDDGSGWGREFRQSATLLRASVPVRDHSHLSLRTSWSDSRLSGGRADAPPVTGLTAVGDVQIGWRSMIAPWNLALYLTGNIPSGQTEMAPGELPVATLLANGVLGLAVPNVGQGFNVAPGATWARTIHPRVAVGAGLSWHYRGAYTPIAAFGEFDPGDEVMATTGLDVRLAPGATISIDLSHVRYSADAVDGETVYDAGAKWMVTTRVKQYVGRHDWYALYRLRSQGPADIPAAGGSRSTLPDNHQIQTGGTLRFGERFHLGGAVALRRYGTVEGASASFSDGQLWSVTLSPTLVPGQRVALPVRLGFATGDFRETGRLNGWQAGLGLALSF